MFKASAGILLPTSIIGSLPRPSWYTAVLGAKTFLEAMVNARYREQYEDAVSVHLRAQETALDTGQRSSWRGERGVYGYIEAGATQGSCRTFSQTVYVAGRPISSDAISGYSFDATVPSVTLHGLSCDALDAQAGIDIFLPGCDTIQ